jgi:hypothetical protein
MTQLTSLILSGFLVMPDIGVAGRERWRAVEKGEKEMGRAESGPAREGEWAGRRGKTEQEWAGRGLFGRRGV